MTGYLLLTSADILIKKDINGSISISYPNGLDGKDIILERPPQSGSTMPRPAGHLSNHLVWTGNWGFKTPRGYSSLITHPLNRFDLPFTTTSGIMDTDRCYDSGNLPFFIKEGFEGLIPKGTPYAQVIPIKRKKWYVAFTPGLEEKMHRVGLKNMNGGYKKISWIKKEY